MDWDGKIQAATLSCHASGQRIAPGEDFWSGLVAQADGSFVRQDYGLAAWPTIDRSVFISWWRQRAPAAADTSRRVRLDTEVLRKLFSDLRDIPRRPEQCLCYVAALCLVRAKAFTLHARPRGNEAELVLEDRHDHSRWLLHDPRMDDQDIARVQQNLVDIISVGPSPSAG